jgi:hypothetical protein
VLFFNRANLVNETKRRCWKLSLNQGSGSMKFDTDSDPRIYPLDYGSSPKTVEIKVYLNLFAC